MSAVPMLRKQPLPLSEIMSISPSLAEAWLKTMVANRPLSESKVIEYAMAMDEGRWSLNGETIKFDNQGQLFDGQHRLQACVLAGKSFRSHVVRGIEDENAFSTVDVGKVRSTADIFGIAGWQNNKVASGAANILFLYRHGRMGWSGPTGGYGKGGNPNIAASLKRGAKFAAAGRDELLAFSEQIKDELQQAVRFANGSPARKVMPAATVAALYAVFRDKSVTEAERFFNDLGEGVGLTKADPVKALRDRLLAAKGGIRYTRWMIIGFTIKCWNKRRESEQLSVLRYIEGEAFPKAK